MAAQVALRRQQAQEENEARELQLLYGTAEGLALAAANGILPPRPAYEVFGSVCAATTTPEGGGGGGGSSGGAGGGAGPTEVKLQKFDLFPKALLPPRSATPQQPQSKPLSPDGADGAAGPTSSSSPEPPRSGSENGDGAGGDSSLGSPLSKGAKDGGAGAPEEQSPLGSISPLGSDSGCSEAEREDPGGASAGLEAARSHQQQQRTPLDILTRVFPAHKRSVLELVLAGCGGDVVQAIEQILNNHHHHHHHHNHHPHLSSSSSSSSSSSDKAGEEGWVSGQPLGAPPQPHHRPLLTGAMTPAIGALGSRSAFSPLQPNATHFGAAAAAEASAYPWEPTWGLSPLRLAYSAAAAAHSRAGAGFHGALLHRRAHAHPRLPPARRVRLQRPHARQIRRSSRRSRRRRRLLRRQGDCVSQRAVRAPGGQQRAREAALKRPQQPCLAARGTLRPAGCSGLQRPPLLTASGPSLIQKEMGNELGKNMGN
uniref:DMRT like family A2 n=1 Tax=Anolis carolinensis TaxID=28377 RepID=G1KGD2_ANOCA